MHTIDSLGIIDSLRNSLDGSYKANNAVHWNFISFFSDTILKVQRKMKKNKQCKIRG